MHMYVVERLWQVSAQMVILWILQPFAILYMFNLWPATSATA